MRVVAAVLFTQVVAVVLVAKVNSPVQAAQL